MKIFANILAVFWCFGIGLSLDCNQPTKPELLNGRKVACEIEVATDGSKKEMTTFECDYGYEFKKNATIRKIKTIDGLMTQALKCSAIGCKLANMPIEEKENNLKKMNSVCQPAILPKHCQPEVSFVDFECLPGFVPDEAYGFLRVKCLESYLWDTTPKCILPEKNEDTAQENQKTLNATVVTDLNGLDIKSSSSSSNNLITTTTNTTRKILLSFPTKGISCRNNIQLPDNYNETQTEFYLVRDTNDLSLFKPGSYVSFQCKMGYFNYLNGRSLMSVCQPNGTWSTVANCEPYPCWTKLIKRPLNGERDVRLVLDTRHGSTNGSYINFSCNPLFELVGNSRLYCMNGVWPHDDEAPKCRLTSNLCRQKPLSIIGQTMLIGLHRIEFKFEKSVNVFELETAFSKALYACLPGYKFKDTVMNVGYKSLNGITMIPYKNVSCIGPEQWEPIPLCVL